MGLSSALSTAVSGLNVNQNTIDVIGNNLANSNTPAFKSFRSEFVNNFYNTLTLGSTPGEANAGTNPRQIGQGANIGSLSTDFRPGSPTQTGVASDLFIQGNGFFTIRRGSDTIYTRDGSFRLNSASRLVTARGDLVQGFGVDSDFRIQRGSIVDLTVPLGALSVAQRTNNSFIEGTLNATGNVATQASSKSTIAGSLAQVAPAGPITATTALNNLTTTGLSPRLLIRDSTSNTFTGPVTVTYTPHKGGRALPAATFVLNPTDTLSDLMSNVFNALGINTATGQSPPAGFTVSGNQITLTGNLGAGNDFDISPSDFVITGLGSDGQFGTNDDTSGSLASDFNFSVTNTLANGESVFTQFTAFDSLGSPVLVVASAYLESVSDDQSVFRMLFESRDNNVLPPSSQFPPGAKGPLAAIGTATLTFDSDGRLIDPPSLKIPITVSRQNAAPTDLSFNLDVKGINALAAQRSTLAVVSQDGSPPGTLIDYSINQSGVIVGTFDNGITRDLGQVTLARFSNPQGLVSLENNLYRQGPNSGLPFITEPGTNGVGSILSGSLELSNVDIAVSFVQLLQSSTAFSANSRVVATAQELFQTLLQLPRT